MITHTCVSACATKFWFPPNHFSNLCRKVSVIFSWPVLDSILNITLNKLYSSLKVQKKKKKKKKKMKAITLLSLHTLLHMLDG